MNRCICCGHILNDNANLCKRCSENVIPYKKNKHGKFYTKWIKGECRHFCLFCSHKGNCLDF